MSKILSHGVGRCALALIVGSVVACSSAPRQSPYPSSLPSSIPAPSSLPPAGPPAAPTAPTTPVLPANPSGTAPTPPVSGRSATPTWLEDNARLPASLSRAKSRWVPVRWAELPGFADDNLFEAWNAWLKSCERPGPVFASLCGEVRQLSISDEAQRRTWLVSRLQPYRVETHGGDSVGLLTSYYEPLMNASRQRTAEHQVPLYQPPPGLSPRQPWHSRRDIDTQPAVKAALRGREIAWLADPVDALILHIQGSGRLRVTEPDGSQQVVRLAFAATNELPYKSVGRWLLDRGAVRDASWPAIKRWAADNPQRVNDMLWSNPRVVFFREEALTELDSTFGPRGAQGVPLTPGRSIAVDPGSIPYGTPVWLASQGPALNTQKLVLAQDTGSAIVGAVRADYFAGSGDDAGELAGRVKQPLRLWALWPK